MKKLIERMVLWVAHYFGAEKQMIPSLHTTPTEQIMIGKMYNWYGRIVKAVKNPKEVKTTYLIWPNKKMSQRAVDLICKNTDKLQMFDTMYRTEDKELGEQLKADGSVDVSEETIGEPCNECCMNKYGLPCPNCNFTRYWEIIAVHKQNATDQEAYMRYMEKKINRR